LRWTERQAYIDPLTWTERQAYIDPLTWTERQAYIDSLRWTERQAYIDSLRWTARQAYIDSLRWTERESERKRENRKREASPDADKQKAISSTLGLDTKAHTQGRDLDGQRADHPTHYRPLG
jgi:hypothetical protein